MKEFKSRSTEDTLKLANALASCLSPGDTLCLDGDLGTGKTLFATGIAKALGVTKHITSPTFTIVNEYKEGILPIYHFDVYRISNSEDMYDIGFEDYFDEKSIIIIEWSKLIADLLPKDLIAINLFKTNENLNENLNERIIKVEGVGKKYKFLNDRLNKIDI